MPAEEVLAYSPRPHSNQERLWLLQHSEREVDGALSQPGFQTLGTTAPIHRANDDAELALVPAWRSPESALVFEETQSPPTRIESVLLDCRLV